ncbi:hypothetical protein [Solimonas marina]|uniref:Uncharacterized protein n=1 Tax=Solimonas marina TaxID=2714601 RepID=A0A969W8I6_9GAMM|nr:hypothetical protein [Solimonas marina]NKF20911.1 hypothetical protein [Solimonas marina]
MTVLMGVLAGVRRMSRNPDDDGPHSACRDITQSDEIAAKPHLARQDASLAAKSTVCNKLANSLRLSQNADISFSII